MNACYDAGIVHRKRFHQRAGYDGRRAYLHQNGSQYGNQSEEEDDEYFPQALVGQRPRPSRIAIGEVEGRDADGAVMRTGPVRRSVSACLAWSMASLKKLQAIWRHRQEVSVRRARDAFQLPVSFCTTMQPAHTGIREAVSVLGRAARKAEVMIFM